MLLARINKYVYILLVIIIFLGVIQGAKGLGYWSVSGKTNSWGKRIELTGRDPEEIRGWMSLGEVARAYNIPLEEILAAFNLPPDLSGQTLLRDVEKIVWERNLNSNFSPQNLREWLKLKTRGKTVDPD
ncbi:MAG: hypothetical protein PWP65_1478 [Clostridia bacterium]|nr:hypothetical protein [Clostridia bacterium]